ncbi:MAG: tetratricopeptide repeat protein [bacterium]|nr:tetratricopeptide repeat protein [bacterium]
MPDKPVRVVPVPAGPLSTTAWDSLNLARATHLWLQDDLRGAVAHLETIDIREGSAFARADRAAFLLAAAHLQLNDHEAFLRVATAARPAGRSPYRRWLAYVGLLVTGAANEDDRNAADEFWDLPGAVVLTAAYLMESGRPRAASELLDDHDPERDYDSVHHYLEALAAIRGGDEATEAWRRLASREPISPGDRDLVSAGGLILAAAEIRRGEDPDATLSRISGTHGTPLQAAQARVMLALAAGDTTSAWEILSRHTPPVIHGPRGRRLAQIAGQMATAAADWPAALQHLEQAATSWERESAWLADLADPVRSARAWRTWTREIPRAGEIPLPVLAWPAALDDLARAATDLTEDPEFVGPGFRRPTAAATGPDAAHLIHARTHRPDPEQWSDWHELALRMRQAEAERGRREYTLAKLTAERDLRRNYLATGSRQASDRTAELAAALRDLDNLLSRLDQALADLDRTRDEALLQFAQRLANLTGELRTAVLYIQAVRHFRAAGPETDLAGDWPAEVPGPAELLDSEQDLIAEIQEFLVLFGERTPDLVDRSCAEIWVPRLTADGPSLRGTLAAQQRRGERLTAAMDSTALALPIDREIARARIRLARQTTVVDSLTDERARTRDEILGQVAARGRERMRREREGLDYIRGNALYWVAIGAGSATENEAGRSRTRHARDRARQALRDYLERFPTGKARAESRFRLADLELLQARDDFQTRMAEFLGEEPSADDLQNKDLAPFVDYGPAVTLYRRILVEDTGFTHLPAVLFQLGMILGDDGDPEFARHLETLVAQYPDSPFNQEAWLRLGDQHFEARDFESCQPAFAAAARGEESSLQAIALYKLGWARFELDQFGDAAGTFGRLLDHYAQGEAEGSNPGRDTDLQDEAEEHFVHALIRAGGAAAFNAHFGRVGQRAYEADVLLAMGHRLAGISLYGEALACDQLWFERFGDRVEALAVAQRQVQSYRRWHKPAEARRVHLALAEHFVPGRVWFTAHRDSLLRSRAQAFAQGAFRNAAVHEHQQARGNSDLATWRRALQHYDAFLAHWPDADAAPRMHHQAGEAAHRLGLHHVALDHFREASDHRAAGSDTAAFSREAAWQVVAVSDAWYRDSRSGNPAVAGADSLARQLLAAADQYRARFPEDEQLPALMWRQGQVAYAHRWYREAADVLSDLGTRHPTDPNALAALRMSGDAWYGLREYASAGDAYQWTLELARSSRTDSVVTVVEPLVPHSHYRHAEEIAAADSVHGVAEAAPLFAQVADRWPTCENADLALYRAGLGYATTDPDAAVAAWQRLLTRYPTSAYARDSALQIAATHETRGQPLAAAAALDRFSTAFAADPDASSALLKASDLLANAGDSVGAEDLKSAFLQRFPEETETVMAIREERAAQALAGLAADQAPRTEPVLRAYLELAATHPKLASPEILARVAFLEAEREYSRYTAVELTQPLPAAIQAKQQSLEELLGMYAACTRYGIAEYTRAAAFRTGQAITHFGDALLASERPAELHGDDLLAYEEVLAEQSWPFYDRGEAAWTDLLRQTGSEQEDPGSWLAQTRRELWPRVAGRFLHLPEAEYPLVAAVQPAEPTADDAVRTEQ